MPTIQFFQPEEGRRFDGPLDLNTHVIRHPAATFFLRVGPDVRGDADVRSDDLLVVDRSVTAFPNAVAVVVRGGELRVERLRRSGDEEAELWGVVTHLIRALP
jgi:SOS-response transcriptional repressor LexA